MYSSGLTRKRGKGQRDGRPPLSYRVTDAELLWLHGKTWLPWVS